MTYQPISDDDDQIFGSAEEYDDIGDTPNMFVKPTRTSLDNIYNGHSHGHNHNNGNHNNHHHGNNQHSRYNNIALFGGSAGTNSGSAASGISGGAGANGGIVTRNEVRGSDNELSTAGASAHFAVNSHNYQWHSTIFAINLLISFYLRLISS